MLVSAQSISRGLRNIVERCLGLCRLREGYRRVVAGLRNPDDLDEFLDECLGELGLQADVVDVELERIPTSGPLLVAANHPHGIADGLVLASLLRRRRSDLRILGNRWLNEMRELRGLVLDVDPIGGQRAASSNTAPMRAAQRWLRQGGGPAGVPGRQGLGSPVGPARHPR